MASLFTRIIKGEIPSYKIFEDEHVFAFLDIRPVHPGHTLVVPKVEVPYFIDVPEPFYSAVFQAAKNIAPAIQRATGAKRIGTAVIGLEVPHFHYHLIPIERVGDLNFGLAKEATQHDLSEMQKKILSYLV